MARLHHDLLKAKARSFWIAPPGGDQPQSTHLLMPQARGLGMPLAEILPIQLLTLHLAAELGFEAGKFRHIGKITLNE
jgi:glucosamine 6-phosphate synthetase-like amidotransferase/phosphosugar isomerase protein